MRADQCTYTIHRTTPGPAEPGAPSAVAVVDPLSRP